MLRHLCLILLLLFAPQLRAQQPATRPIPGDRAIDPQFQTDLQTFAGTLTRVIGSPGYVAAAEYIRSQIRNLPNVELREQTYPVMMPVTKSATLKVGGAVFDVYPFWPAGVRLNATPAGGITANLVYAGKGDLRDIRPATLRGQIAVIEAVAQERWTQAGYFGAQAVLILGDAATTNADLRSHEIPSPLNLLRFYVTGEAAAKVRELSRAGDVSATLDAQVNWTRTRAVNVYALVTGSAAQPGGWKDRMPPGAMVVSVPFESSGLVPDLAPGAGQAAQTAAGLALLRDLSRHPLDRPVLFAFTGGDSLQFSGTRSMLMAFAQSPRTWEKELGALSEGGRDVAEDLTRIAPIQADSRSVDIRKDARLGELITKAIEADIVRGRTALFEMRSRSSATSSATDQAAIDRLVAEQASLGAIKYGFQRDPSTLDSKHVAGARRYISAVAQRLERQAKDDADRARQLHERVDLYQWLAGKLRLNPDPAESDYGSRLIELLIALDLSGDGVRVGPMDVGAFQTSNAAADLQDYKDWFSRQSRGGAAAWLKDNLAALDLSPMLDSSRSPQTWLAGSLPIGSEMAQAWGVPGFSLITLDDARKWRDTPSDTVENVNFLRIAPQLRAVRDLISHAWNDATFKGPAEKRPARVTFTGQVVSAAPDRPIPDIPREGFLATFYYLQNPSARIPALATLPYTPGVRRIAITDTDAQGNYRFEGIPRLGPDPQMRKLAVQAYRVAPDTGAIDACTDLGQQTGELPLMVDLNADTPALRSVVFDCAEFSLFGLYDPRFLQNLGELVPLDARRNTSLDRYNFVPYSGMLAGFVEPDSRLQLLFRFGSVGNRLMLLNVRDPSAPGGSAIHDPVAASQGFSTAQLQGRAPADQSPLLPAALQTAQDFWRLNDLRLAGYASAGISSAQLDAMHKQASQQVEDASLAYARNDAPSMMDLSTSAWATETRVYKAAQDLGNDVVRAAIFLLLLCVPFAFCMERLLVASTNIYKQLAWAAGIFALMTAALATFHPAFKISSSPLVIVLAFAIIFMAVLVIALAFGKFDTELKRIRSGRGDGPATGVAGSGVMSSAVLLGIASMRRRKFRTLLTSITIVLITFAVLCFTSSSRYLDTMRSATGSPSPYPGLLLRQRGFRPMPTATIESVATALGQMGVSSRVVEQWWNVNVSDPNGQINVVADSGNATEPPRVFPAAAVLGLSPGVAQLHKPGEVSPLEAVLGPDKLARLEKGERDIIYFARSIADQLHVKEGGFVTIAGIRLQVAGVFDDADYDKRVISLSGEPLRPLSYRIGELDAGGRSMVDDPSAETLSLGGDSSAAETGASYEHLPAGRFVIVPAEISRLLPNASLRTLTIPLPDDASVKRVSDELSKRFSLAVFAGDPNGVSLVAASNLQSISGAGQVAVPIAIAGLIVFNTMMGSIAERRREIHVYTSLGLAPIHVGALFVAEAMTYGLIGTVFGYVIGQGAGTLLLKLGLLGNVTLNYSGTSAMLTMGLILLIVFLSALVPARLASKIAAPSIDRNWKVPLPKGDEIIADLPFTISKTAADGALAYLADFFDANREGSIGKFNAGHVDPFTFESETGQPHRGLKTLIWLTPFDLGVRQHMMLLIHPGQYPDIYEVQVVLQRLSGDDASWYRLNRTFLTLLRQQFLQWRSLSPQRMKQYADASRSLFAGADGTDVHGGHIASSMGESPA